MNGQKVDLRAVTEGEGATSGLSGGEALTALAEASLRGDEAALASARQRLLDALGEPALIDAAGVIGNFQRMVRIADGTGIPLDEPVAMISADMREELGIDAYGGAAGTAEVRGVKRVLGRMMRRTLPAVLKVLRYR